MNFTYTLRIINDNIVFLMSSKSPFTFAIFIQQNNTITLMRQTIQPQQFTWLGPRFQDSTRIWNVSMIHFAFMKSKTFNFLIKSKDETKKQNQK